MIPIEMKKEVQFEFSTQMLFELELRVARRADELVKTALSIPGRSLECWLRAEREVFGEMLSSELFGLSSTKIQ